MEKITYTIGRDVRNDIKLQDASVSGFHAQVTLLDEALFEIEDLYSTNGTFVNGNRVKRAKAKYTDLVRVAGVVVNVRKQIKDFQINQQGHCAPEFNALKKLHDDYKAARSSLTRKQNLSNAVRLSLPNFVAGGINLATGWLDIATGVQQACTATTAAGLSLLWVYLGGSKVSEQLTRLDEEFTEKYRCPRCGHSLKGRSWETWKDERVCPNCKILWVEE